MSLIPVYTGVRVGRFPRVSGDEPLRATAGELGAGFSPRERG